MMQTYIALLRGINVSGQKKIKMADLKISLENLKLENITTYIQSGNVVFTSKKSVTELEDLIHDKILKDFGFDVAIIIKTPQELKHVLNNNPFALDLSNDPKLFYAVFLKDDPKSENIQKLAEVDYSPEKFVLEGQIIYFYAANGAAKARMSNNFFESKLKIAATTRNWNTVKKLSELSQSQ